LHLALAKEPEDDIELFREAIKDARPLKQPPRVLHPTKKPRPVPQQFIRDELQALADSLSDHFIPAHELESGEELLYLRDGHSPDLLRKLRRGHWVIQEQLDLHGMRADEARLYVVEFLALCKKRGARCVRIIHGKGLGSKNREPVLKNKLRSWLMQRDEVLAYCQAREVDGGAGALVVLLKSAQRPQG
jgi:DNA-nicking Smr family endonuclease